MQLSFYMFQMVIYIYDKQTIKNPLQNLFSKQCCSKNLIYLLEIDFQQSCFGASFVWYSVTLYSLMDHLQILVGNGQNIICFLATHSHMSSPDNNLTLKNVGIRATV